MPGPLPLRSFVNTAGCAEAIITGSGTERADPFEITNCAVVFTGIHIASLMLDTYVEFGVREILVAENTEVQPEPAQCREFNTNKDSVEDLDVFPYLQHVENITDSEDC